MPSLNVDFAVVGSSPLLVMLALKLRRAGWSVAIIEREKALGGAWQTENIAGIGEVECACHLLEWYWGGYEDLYDLTQTPLIGSDPQPVRVFKDGTRVPYTSRRAIAKAFYFEARAVAAATVRAVFANREDRHMLVGTLTDRLLSIAFYIRHRLPGLIFFDTVKMPSGGYTEFMSRLTNDLADSGALLVYGTVQKIDTFNEHAVAFVDDQQIRARKIFVGDSSDPVALNSKSADDKDYHHIVVGIGASSAVERNPYVHLPDDDLFHRVTYIKDHAEAGANAEALYLVQLRKPANQFVDLISSINEIFVRCRIVVGPTRVTVHKEFSKHYPVSRRNGARSKRSAVVHPLQTSGDLSRSIVLARSVFNSIGHSVGRGPGGDR